MWVSSGPRAATVPTLVGQTERTAHLRLEQDGLEVASISEFRSPDYPADVIVAQDPPPASRAPQVALLVNRGEPATTYVMPDVIGMDGERAAQALRMRGFRVAIVGSQPYPGVPAGHGGPSAAGRRVSGGAVRRDLSRGQPMSAPILQSRRRSSRQTSRTSGATSPRSKGAAPT